MKTLSKLTSISKAQLEILESLPEAVSIHGESGRLVWASAATCEVLQTHQEALAGFGFLERVNPQDQILLLKQLEDVRAGCTPNEITIRKLDLEIEEVATPTVLEVRAKLMPAAYNDFVLLSVKNITKQVEKERQLLEALQDAEKANQLKNSVIANVSHELRTPLNAIIGFSEILCGDTGEPICPEKQIEYAGHIKGSAAHLLGLINGILDVSKIEAGKLQISAERLDLAEVMHANLKLMEPIAVKSGISIETRFDENCPYIFADKGAVRQISHNLVSNALKFSERGDRITVSITRKAQSVCLNVRDYGIGMDEATIANLGKTFFQAEHKTGNILEGSGLGLSIVKGLVELHKGSLRFESEPDVGTQAIVELPLNTLNARPVPVNPDNTLIFINNNKKNSLQQMPVRPVNTRKMG